MNGIPTSLCATNVQPISATRRVWSCNEWDPLEEVVLGTALGARFPTCDASTQFLLHPGRSKQPIPQDFFPERVIQETEEDLFRFADVLASIGVRVVRPGPYDTQAVYSTPHWSAHGFHRYCPRDTLTVVGDNIIEAPTAMRSRMFETLAYRSLLVEYLNDGARWFAAPKPTLRDSVFAASKHSTQVPSNEEPIFDAANVLRLGRDLLYLVSCSANELGARWLQLVLGDGYTVHPVAGVYSGCHIDSTFAILRPGLVLCNPSRVSQLNLPAIFHDWEVLYSPPMTLDDESSSTMIGSEWIGMNVFSINPSLVVVDIKQRRLAALLERRGLNVIPLALRHARRLGGGFHCVTLDIRRSGVLERYCHSHQRP